MDEEEDGLVSGSLTQIVDSMAFDHHPVVVERIDFRIDPIGSTHNIGYYSTVPASRLVSLGVRTRGDVWPLPQTL